MMVRDLRPLAGVVAVMVAIDALWIPFILGWAKLLPTSYQAIVMPMAGNVDLSQVIFTILTMIVFAVWIYCAGRNLAHTNAGDLEFSPASRVWWFAVPILNLFKPFQGMRELWNASHDQWPYDTNQALISTWWAIWLFKNYGGGVLRAMGRENVMLLWIDVAIDIVAAVVALRVVFGITYAQLGFGRESLAEMFA